MSNINIYVSEGQGNSPYYIFYSEDDTSSYLITTLNLNNTYTFKRLNNATSHPFYISNVGYEQVSTDAITLDGSGSPTSGITGTESFTLSFNANYDISNPLYYYCTSHSNMVSIYYLPIWQESQELYPPSPTTGEFFGYSVDIYNNNSIIGARAFNSPSNTDTGAAYIFTLQDGSWNQTQKLYASDSSTSDSFGYSVSIDSSNCIISAIGDDSNTGAAYIFTLQDGSWNQIQKLIASDPSDGDSFGYSVSINGDNAIVGCVGNDSSRGAAYIFTLQDGSWNQIQKLTASDADEYNYFGISVSINGNTAVVGANGNLSYNGAAYVFTLQDRFMEPNTETNR